VLASALFDASHSARVRGVEATSTIRLGIAVLAGGGTQVKHAAVAEQAPVEHACWSDPDSERS
jgi:hypothetical protein